MNTVSRQSFGRVVLAGSVMVLFALMIALGLRPGPQVQAQEASQAIIQVPDDYATIQAAINAAGDWDTVQVAQGTYTENLVITKKNIALEGGWRSDWLARDPAVYMTVIDGNQAGRVLSIVGPCTSTVDGFVVTNGKMDSGGGIGVMDASPILRNNVIHQNQAINAGGGIELQTSPNTLILESKIYNNQASTGGGIAIYYSDDVVIRDNKIYLNQSTGDGGGLGWYSSGGYPCERGVLSYNEIYSNTAGYSSYYDGGGAIIVGIAITVSHNLLQGNTALGGGGGLRLDGDSTTSAVISGNILYNNSARWGGGLSFSTIGSFIMVNNIIARNNSSEHLDGIILFGDHYCPLQGTLINNTIVDNNPNTGCGIYQSSHTEVIFENNIIAGHAVGLEMEAGATVWADYTLWHGNGTDIGGPGTWTNDHPVYGDPRFVDPAGGDYHIQAGSAGRDAGDPAGVPPAPPTDIDGDTRPQGFRVDIGADECFVLYDHFLFLPLVSKDY